jgi:hypothetical protein
MWIARGKKKMKEKNERRERPRGERRDKEKTKLGMQIVVFGLAAM